MIAESLIYLFQADTDNLQKGEKEAFKTNQKLDDALQETDDTANDLGSSFSDMLAVAGGALTALVSFGAMAAGIAEAAEYSDELGKLSRRLGENANDMAAFQEVVAKSGGSVSGFQGTVQKLNADFNEFATTGNSSILPFMQRLGVSMIDAEGNTKSVLDTLPELAEQFEGLSKAESAGLGAKLGLDEGTILLLQQGRAEVEKQIGAQQKLFSITDEQIAAFESFNDAVSDTQTAFRGLFVEMGADIVPIFEFFLNKIQDVTVWMKENKTFMTGVFIALGTAITAFAIPPMISFMTATIAAFAPFYAIGAVVAGLVLTFALLYDDIVSFLNGGGSAFEDMLKWLGMSSEEIEGVRESFRALGDAISVILDVAIQGFKFLLKTLANIAGSLFTMFEPLLKFFAESLVGAIRTAIAWMQKAAEWAKGVADFFGFGDDDEKKITLEREVTTKDDYVEDEDQTKIRDEHVGVVLPQYQQANNIGYDKEQLNAANDNPLNNMNSNYMQTTNNTHNQKSNNVTVDKIEVNTQATDAETISREIGNSLQNELKRTTANYEDGIDG
jgi:hypothetical protein